MSARYTVAEIAERLGVDRESARGFVRFALDASLVTDRGVRTPERGRTGTEKVYSFASEFEKELVQRVRRAGF